MRPRTTLIATGLGALALAAPGISGAEAHDGGDEDSARYRAMLRPLNQDGAGKVRLRLEGDHLVVRVKAKRLDGGVHLAHIHGIRQAENECPTRDLDGDGNGFVDLLEGLPAYGPVQRTLSNGLDDRGRKIRYTRTFTVLDDGSPVGDLGDLSQYAVVLHGVDLDGDGVATNPDVQGDGASDHDDNEISMPALCGTIEPHD